ncbi:MAG: caspase family protein [Rhizobiaceae bacterium]|nr:caspase family protein [Rhizobiaceae bacterium]
MRVLLFFTLMTFAVGPVSADTRVALIVANSAYRGAPLLNPGVDAQLVRGALRELGFDVTLVENAKLKEFDLAVREFSRRVRGADVALFYYAGHGFALTDRGVAANFLMSTDADITDPSDRVLRAGGVALDEIILEVSAGAKASLIFIDACRNDPRVSRSPGTQGRGAVPVTKDFDESIFLGMSTRAGQVAEDGEGGDGSPFARAFAANIGTPGARIDDVFTKIRLDVEAITDERQRPDVGRYDLDEPVVLRPGEARSAALDNRAAEAREVRVRHMQLDTMEEAEAAIRRLDSGEEFADVARAVSQEANSAEMGGDLGWFGRGVMVPEFEKEAFSLDVGAYSKVPVQTQFGWHIIKVDDRRR